MANPGELTQVAYRVDENEGIAFVSMNRPKYRNAISRVMTFELDAAFKAACEDPRVKVIILRGEGDHFSSGHDLGTKEQNHDLRTSGWGGGFKYQKGPSGTYRMWSENDVEMCLSWRQLAKPVLGGVKGYTIYHGWAVAASCDILLAAEDVKIIPGLVEMNSLPYDLALNSRKAKELLFNRRYVLAEEAEELGMVNRVVKKEDLDEELIKMAKVIAKADPFHLRMMKLTVNQAQDAAGMSTSMRSALSAFGASTWSDNSQGRTMDPDGQRGGGKQTFAPMAHAGTDEAMYYSETAAIRAAPKRRSNL